MAIPMNKLLVSMFVIVAVVCRINGLDSSRKQLGEINAQIKCTSCSPCSPCDQSPPPPPPISLPPPPPPPPKSPPPPKKKPPTSYNDCPPPPSQPFIYITGPPGDLYPVETYGSAADFTRKSSTTVVCLGVLAVFAFL